MDRRFWKDKSVFITGHTGFKGGWLSLWLQDCGAKLTGYSLKPKTNPNLYDTASVSDGMNSIFGDIRDLEFLTESLVASSPDVVFHMAAQPLVRFSYENPIDTYTTNVIGTINLFEAVRKSDSVRAVVNVTTDKCYENKEWIWGYREDDAMGGRDPYSSSKACSELVTQAYRKSFFNSHKAANIASGRAGNVIGGGDWAEDRLIPDILKALIDEKPVEVRNPFAIRPWQHVLEPLSGYLTLAERLWVDGEIYAGGWNFGPEERDIKRVSSVTEYLVEHWGAATGWVHDESEQPHEAQLLKLDISKAKSILNWSPTWNLNMALDSVIEWHQEWLKGRDLKSTTIRQIHAFENDETRINE